MKKRIIGILAAVGLSAGLLFVGAAAPAYAAPGDSAAEPIILEPNHYEGVDACGTDGDAYVLVKGATGQTGQSNFLTSTVDDSTGIVDPTTLTGYAQTGVVRGVYYAFEGVQPDLNGVYTVKTVIPKNTNVPCENIVVPTPLPAPTQNADGTFNLPTVDGVFYGIYEYETETLIVASTYGHPGYVLAGDQTYYEWSFPKAAVSVTAKAPTWSDPAGPNNATWIYTDTDAYKYTQTKYSNGKVKLVASAKPGYVLTGTTQWQKIGN